MLSAGFVAETAPTKPAACTMWVMRWRFITSSRRGMSSTSPSSMSTSSRMSRISHSSRCRAKMTGRYPSCTNRRLVSAPMTPIPPVIRTFMASPGSDRAGDGMADAQGHGIDQHEGKAGALIAAVGPGVMGAALNHDVASLHLHRRIVHVHLDLALEHDNVVDSFRAVHARRVAGREIDDRETGAVCRRRGTYDARARWGWGSKLLDTSRRNNNDPPPQPSPTRGEGADRAMWTQRARGKL